MRILVNAAVGLAVMGGGMMAPTIASAQAIEFRLGEQPRVVIPDRNRDRDFDRDRRGPPARGCSANAALAAARNEGFRRAEVVSITSRRVTVEGITRRGPDRISFANVRGCPEL